MRIKYFLLVRKFKCHIVPIYKIFLAFYIFFLGFASLHYDVTHHYDNNASTHIGNEPTSNIFDPFWDNNSECQLLAFAANLYTAALSSELLLNSLYQQPVFLILSEKKPDTYLFGFSTLRAPPTI
jgi:hypothetical protein